MHRFSELFEQTTDAVKVQFLKQILAQNMALKAQFTKYAETYAGSLIPDSTSTSSYAEVLKNVREEIALHLESLSFNEEDLFDIGTYLSKSEKDRLIEDVRLTYHDEFYVQLLAAEERYADILERVRARTHANQFLDQLMELILTVYPDECFRILHRKCEETVLERGRLAYQLIARWLQLMKRIEGYQPQTAQLASQLYYRKPNLPALKDEMRRAGVAPA